MPENPSMRTRKTRNPRPAVVMLAVVLLLGGAGDLAAAPESPSYAGRPLAEALEDLQARGLDLFYTSNLVRPEMRVETEPTPGELREILDQLLAPHGLISEVGPGGRLMVVLGEPIRSGIRGLVRERQSGIPLPGVRILIPGVEGVAYSADDGSFLLPDVAVGTHPLEAHLPGFVVERIDEVPVPGDATAEVLFELVPAPLPLDEIVVTPSQVSLLREDPVTTIALDRDDIFALPHLGDDIFRALTLFPGVTAEEVSARFNVRGGRGAEVLVLLDRVELFEPYHLKDYSSALSIIAPRALSEVQLITGGFPVQYGDRMSGVLDMKTRLPERRRTHLGLGTLSAEIGSSGTFHGQRGNWLGSLRRGSLDLTLEFLGKKEKPQYWDGFGKVEYQLRPGQRLSVHLLHSDDDLGYHMVEPDVDELYRTSYNNSYFWLSHQGILSPRLFADIAASVGRVERDRRGDEIEFEEEGAGFTLRDERALDVVGLKQDWNLQASERHYLRWGFDVRRMTTDYDYVNLRELEDPLAEIRSEPRTGTTSLRERLHGEHYSVYLSDRWRPVDPLTVELGLRYDRQTLTDDRHLSPRFNLVYAPGRTSALRVAWGYFYQSQRPYELGVEDGETELASAERTEQRVLSFEHTFAKVGQRRSDLHLRVELYQRLIRDPRVRYENLFEPISIYPEIEPDRFRVAPERSEAYGIEFFLRGTLGRHFEWWMSYAYARVEDLIDGRDVPRRIDQPHTFNFDLNYNAGRHWRLNLAWRYHSGWPTTAIMGGLEENEEGEVEFVPVFGPINAERLPPYHRLDLRASREWQKKKGVLGFYLEIQNVYDRENIAGFDVDFEFKVRPDGGIDVVPEEEEIWGGILPSFGITWDF